MEDKSEIERNMTSLFEMEPILEKDAEDISEKIDID